jgi:hypothetical protein
MATPPNTIGRWCSAHCPLGKVLAACALLVSLAPAAWAGDGEARSWRVVILDSSDPSQPAAQTFSRVSREALTRRTSRRIEFYPEFLDALRFQGAVYDAEIVGFLTKKYQAAPPDLIVTIYPQALQFLAQHRTELWPDTPVVFVAVPDDLPLARTPPPGFTGVLTLVDIAGTIELARQLQPELRRVVVVSGASEFDRLWRTRAEEALRRVAPDVGAAYLDGLSVPDLLKAVAKLSKDDVVLFTTVFRDGNGEAWLANDVAPLISTASPVPVYGTFEPSLGHGVVGGSFVGLEAEAARAGELAAAILNGRRPETIPVDPSPSAATLIDWREFERWHLSEDRLPRGTVVRVPIGVGLERVPRPHYWRHRGPRPSVSSDCGAARRATTTPNRRRARTASGRRARPCFAPCRGRRDHRVDCPPGQPAARGHPHQRGCCGNAARDHTRAA